MADNSKVESAKQQYLAENGGGFRMRVAAAGASRRARRQFVGVEEQNAQRYLEQETGYVSGIGSVFLAWLIQRAVIWILRELFNQLQYRGGPQQFIMEGTP